MLPKSLIAGRSPWGVIALVAKVGPFVGSCHTLAKHRLGSTRQATKLRRRVSLACCLDMRLEVVVYIPAASSFVKQLAEVLRETVLPQVPASAIALQRFSHLSLAITTFLLELFAPRGARNACV